MSKESRPILLFIILFGVMFLVGYVENFKGVSFPLIKSDFNISYEQQGLMVSILSISYVLFCFIAGVFIARLGVKKTYYAGFIFMILGLTGTFFLQGFLFVFFALFVISASFGLFEVCSNALASQIFTKRAALLMSLLHFFYGAGSIFGPRAAGSLASAADWRTIYILSVPLTLLFFIPFLVTRFPGRGGNTKENNAIAGSAVPVQQETGFFQALKNPLVWIFALVLGLMVAVEISSANWAGLYFQDVFGLDPRISGAAFISNFYILFTISRLLSGFAIEKIGYLRSLFIASYATVIVYIIGFASGANGIYILPALGFFTAIFWPTLLATAMIYFGKNAPVMTSAIIVIAGVINSGIQFLMGLANRFIGPAWGYRSGIVYALLVIAALNALARRIKR